MYCSLNRLYSIILDEIHSIGQQEGGAVWEQIILLAPCPIMFVTRPWLQHITDFVDSGLSATVGAPEIFNTWLGAVQEAHGYKHSFISHPHRYSHLRKFTYALQLEPNEFRGLDVYKSTNRARFLHPIASLSFGVRSLPTDLALEASDALKLYNALVLCGDAISFDLRSLEPTVFFPDNRFLRQEDIVRYEVALKAVLSDLIGSYDPRETSSPLRGIIRTLEDPVIRKIPSKLLNTAPTRMRFRENLIHLVSDLHVDGNLASLSLSNPSRDNS
jgi:ATP-dependent RNA helicase DDX60